MKSIRPAFALLACIAASPAFSQQLQQATVPTSKPAVAPQQSGVGPQLKQAQPSQAPRVSADPAQRPQAPAAIPSTGPAKQVPVGPATPATSKPPASVLDASGKPRNGLIQVAPNRVMDPATGRYHWTDGSGSEQKLLD